MSIYAEFVQVGNHWFRYDTRVYLNGQPKSQADGHCIAAVIGKNPGSAGPTNETGWQPIALNGDKMLPYIRNRFLEAYAKAKVLIPDLAYVQVLNLFYLCGKSLRTALKSYGSRQEPQYCQTEGDEYPIEWFVWGGQHPALDALKARFLNKSIAH